MDSITISKSVSRMDAPDKLIGHSTSNFVTITNVPDGKLYRFICNYEAPINTIFIGRHKSGFVIPNISCYADIKYFSNMKVTSKSLKEHHMYNFINSCDNNTLKCPVQGIITNGGSYEEIGIMYELEHCSLSEYFSISYVSFVLPNKYCKF